MEVYTQKHTFSLQQSGGHALFAFGTAQDIPAGFYQPVFQDTPSLGYGATEPAKNTHARAHTQTLASTLTTATSQQRQKQLF